MVDETVNAFNLNSPRSGRSLQDAIVIEAKSDAVLIPSNVDDAIRMVRALYERETRNVHKVCRRGAGNVQCRTARTIVSDVRLIDSSALKGNSFCIQTNRRSPRAASRWNSYNIARGCRTNGVLYVRTGARRSASGSAKGRQHRSCANHNNGTDRIPVHVVTRRRLTRSLTLSPLS
jgi:hypothetical protein